MTKILDFNFSLATRICFGLESINNLGKELKDLAMSKVLIVTDAGIVRAGIVQLAINSLNSSGISHTTFQDVASNPTTENSEQAGLVARMEQCDAIIAIGGGSAIDAAKGAAIIAICNGRISDYEGWENIPKQPLPIIAIPTTAGTGSEVSYWAVISNSAEHRKMLIGSPKIAPSFALLDPTLTYSLPPNLTAYTGIDALTHAIEAYTSTASNPISDALALSAIERIGKSLLKAVESPTDEEARSNMLIASTMAAAAFNSADLGAVHCISEALGGLYDVHHGLANAVVLLAVMEYNAPAVTEKYSNIAFALGAKDGDAVRAVSNLIQPLNIPRLRELGVRQEDLPGIASLAAQNISVPSNPREINEENFLKLLTATF
jgi:alcohol dehydrogenase